MKRQYIIAVKDPESKSRFLLIGRKSGVLPHLSFLSKKEAKELRSKLNSVWKQASLYKLVRVK